MIVASSAAISERHQQRLSALFPQHSFLFCKDIGEVLDYRNEVEILLTYGEDLTAEDIEKFPRLKWIQVLSAGVERLPFQALETRNIWVTNARGIHRVPMSEYTLGLMLHHVRRFDTFFANQQKAVWDRSPRVDELAGKTVGILGAGAIGSEIARKAKIFDMKVIGLSRTGESQAYYDQLFGRDQLEIFLNQSDFVIVILPLTPETKGFLGERELKMMKKGSVLINIARGAVIEEEALIKALNEEWIAAAYLDVFIEEPLPETHPFWKLKNCWITPHVSGRSPHYMSRALEIFIRNLHLFQEGNHREMENIIDLNRGY